MTFNWNAAIKGGYEVVGGGKTFDPSPRNKQYQLLIEEQAYLRATHEEILDTPGALSAAEQEAEGQITARLAEIQTLLVQHEAHRAADRRQAIEAGPASGAEASSGIGGFWNPGDPVTSAMPGQAAGPRYRQMFRSDLGDTGGFRSLGEMLDGLQAGMWDQRYAALQHMAVLSGADSNGTGLQIPEQFAAELFDMALEGEIVRPRARLEPMTSDTKRIAGLTLGTGGAPFGISGGWTEEAAEISTTDPKSRSVQLTANKLAALVQISNEAAADGTAVDTQLSTALPRGLSWFMDDGFLRGTGAGMPLGILNASATITVAKETGQAAATIYYENLIAMLARMHTASFNNSIWVANPTTIPQLLQLGQILGTGGVAVPVLRETPGAGFVLLTRPIIFSEKASALGTKGDIMLCDLSQYAVGMRAGMVLDKSAHVGFTRDTTYYRAKVRVDGQPMWDAPYTPAHGDTTSPFVVLATRA